ncbi:hypothetical protein [Hymenobacter sp. B81]|uniref:hypothetical protein n=1 Tax=Hymenobacter sp. B81 TaxID=3344878 RepID=UPI0037DC6CCC
MSLFSCSSDTDESIPGYQPHEIIVVTLNLEANQNIEKIVLQAESSKDSLLKPEITNKASVKLKCPQNGEGTYSLCVYRTNDTLCSPESYIEGGYRPKLVLKRNMIEVVEWH